MSTDPKGVANDVTVNRDITSVGSCRSLCSHASKALRVRSSTTKDRHCKVNTPKGHRDRRVRLAVSTATQLYNLQDKLGLHQPSKVLDWLMNKAKSSIDGLPRPSSISNIYCRSCNTVQNNGATVVDNVSTSKVSDRISQSVPKILPFSIEKTENKTGSRTASLEEIKEENLNVAADHSMLQNRAEASASVNPICSKRKRLKPSVLLKKRNMQEKEGIVMMSPFREQSRCFDVGFSFPDNINAFLAPVNSLSMPSLPWHEEGARTDIHSQTPPLPSWETQFETDPAQIMIAGTGNRLPFVAYSSHFGLSINAGETSNLSEKCTTPFVYSLQDTDSIYVEEALRLSGNINSNIRSRMPRVTPDPL